MTEPWGTAPGDFLASVRRWPEHCWEEVTRSGHAEPCDRPAVAVRLDPEEGTPYPVCARHARRQMVPLSQLFGGDS